MLRKKVILLTGTLVSYIILYFIPSIKFAPFPFLFFFLSIYFYFGNLNKTLFITAAFAIPYSFGKSLLPLGESNTVVVTPFIAGVMMLSLLSIRWRKINQSISDVVLILFLIWGIVSYLFFNTNQEAVDGVFNLGVAVLFYLLTRIYISDKKIVKMIAFIFILSIVFESVLSIAQFLAGKPLGLFIEEGLKLYPFGRLADEDLTLFRASGSFPEPTYLARFLTMLFSFVLIKLDTVIFINQKIRYLIIFMALLAIFATFTRFSWIVTGLLLIFLFIWKKPKINLIKLQKHYFFPLFLMLGLVGYLFFPLIMYRLSQSSFTLTDFGSLNFRVKLIQEAFNLISQYPFFGVGLNNFTAFASENNITGIFSGIANAKVHNVFLLIASEMGLPALIFFLAFVLSSYFSYFYKKRKYLAGGERNFMDLVCLGGLVYLLESMVGTIFLTPHLALFLLYMAMINSL